MERDSISMKMEETSRRSLDDFHVLEPSESPPDSKLTSPSILMTPSPSIFQFSSPSHSNHGSNQNSPSVSQKQKLTNMVTQSKYKLMASFYNIVHSKPAEPPPFSLLPIWLMGRCYHQSPIQESNNQEENNHQSLSQNLLGDWTKKQRADQCMPDHLKEFFLDFQTRLCFCYRKDFVPLEPLGLTTDLGWGCMLRTGQMMMATVLMRLILGRDWRLDIFSPPLPHSYYRQIVRWFHDDPSESSPYSIHNLLRLSRMIDKKAGESASGNKVGEWFTPTRVSQIFKKIVSTHHPESLQMYVSSDSAIYRNQVYQICKNYNHATKHSIEKSEIDEKNDGKNIYYAKEKKKSKEEGENEDPAAHLLSWKPVFIQIPLRLGLEKISKMYVNSIRHLFTIEQNVGIVGGKPKQSLYFVGFQGDQLIFLDPHEVRPCMGPESPFDLHNVHSSVPQKMPIDGMDPSLCVGFFCATEEDFDQLCRSIEQFNFDYPESAIITIEETAPDYVEEEIDFDMADLVIIDRS